MSARGHSTELPTLRAGRRGRDVPGADRFAIIGAEVDVSRLDAELQRRRDTVVDRIAADRDSIEANIEAFTAWFGAAGHRFPLRRQLERTVAGGLPGGPAVVVALMYCEMVSGVLLGVHDLHSVRGGMQFDLADEGEAFDGFRGPVRTAHDEPVLRDGDGIIASVFQGPDLRTIATGDTTALVFDVFDSPGLLPAAFDHAAATIRDLLVAAGSQPIQTTITID